MKTNLRVWMLAMLCALLATTALADVRPPVELRLLGEPHALVPGEVYKGQLELVTDEMADFTDFRFEGDGWRQRQLDVPSSVFLDKGGRLVMDFELEANDTHGVLEFVYEFDGFTMRHRLDLNQEHLTRMTTPGALSPVRDNGRAEPAGPEMTKPEAPPVPEADKSTDSDEDDAPNLMAKRTININGRFVYQRDGGVTIGADGLQVVVYDKDDFFDDVLANIVTDAQGYYSVNINTNDAGETNPDLYIRFRALNGRVNVKDNTWGNTYEWQTGVQNNFTLSTWNVGSLQPSDEGQHPALHILTDVTRTWRWIFNREGFDTPPVDCRWPDGASGAFYNGSIHVSTGRQWNEATHTHEYGHHWIGNFAVQIAPDYCNDICDDGDDCGHCIWCRETDHDAFSEGWPNWLADVLTRSYAGDYGIAPSVFRSQENLRPCTGTIYHDPLRTEGFLGAILRDIEDSTNDDHPQYPGFADVMSWGTNEIFNVVDLDHSTTPIMFLKDFLARYPSSKELLWETSKNCGIELDVLAPGAATSLNSSHPTFGDSPDPTIAYAWGIPYDDVSGIAGYGILISGSPGLPAPTQDIGDVSSYITVALAPGTYYFNLRAVDRAGRWSGSYASYGPVTIRAAEPSDLTYRISAAWDYPVVPRNDGGGTAGATSVSPILDGNANTTRWNVRGTNQGESATSTGFSSKLYVDEVVRYIWSWGVIGAGGNFFGINGGPFTVVGGRHTFEVKYDANDAVAEENENNNVYAHQFIWTPFSLARSTPMTRLTPPKLVGGWNSIVDGQVKYYNCDGLAVSLPGWWNAITVRALSDANDYDVRLHASTTGSENGFGANMASSGRAAGCLDAVLFNANVTSTNTYNAGVLNWNTGTGSYVTEQVISTGMAFGDSIDIAFADSEFLVLKEFWVAAEDIGSVSITVDIDPADGPVYVQWRDKFFATGALTTYNNQATTDPVTGRARLDINIGDSGYNGLAIYRDPKDGSSALTATVEIQQTPPDFVTYYAAGWYGPLVPRPANDGTAALVAKPDTLYGNIASTYLNMAVQNNSPTSSSGLLARVYLDGVYKWWLTWGSFPGNGISRFNWITPWTVRGGRHAMDIRLDPLQAIEEIWENNNGFGEQYVWSPLEVAMGTQVTRNMPPNRIGGWNELTSGAAWYNCDGLRLSSPTKFWHAMAIMPGVNTDVDVRLHQVLQGTQNGFGSSLAYSGWGMESSDFVLVNYNLSPSNEYDVGALNLSGSGGYTVDHQGAFVELIEPIGQYSGFTVPSGRIVNVHEVYLLAGSFAVHLIDDGGGVDWGISLMPADTPYMSKSSAMASSWSNPDGGNEQINGVTVPIDGYYCIVVWKAKTDDLPKNGSYSLVFGNRVSDVPDQAVPQVTALRTIYPNPFNPQTTIVFDLARPTSTEIAIYDLKGSLIRTLTSEAVGAGRHEVVWNGTDSSGQRVASGVYMARMRAGDYSEMKKLMLVK